MNRGLIVGAIAFAAGYAAERLYTKLAPDIAHYNKMRSLSGQDPLWKELVTFGRTAFGAGDAKSIVADLTNDVVRYARMKAM
jgi:hypothetical protein